VRPATLRVLPPRIIAGCLHVPQRRVQLPATERFRGVAVCWRNFAIWFASRKLIVTLNFSPKRTWRPTTPTARTSRFRAALDNRVIKLCYAGNSFPTADIMSQKAVFFQCPDRSRTKIAAKWCAPARSTRALTRLPAHSTQRGWIVPLLLVMVVIVALAALYGLIVWKWSYSTGERVGVVQKISNKGWICKTWEGELNMVVLPGGVPDKFFFTVWDDKVAASINKTIGKRVTLHYEEKIGLPTSCFGDTRHYITKVQVLE
jgi:hypothetical protein